MSEPSNNPLPERYALYYPFIHIRDANWLKATLLWFKQVRRIVPEQFSLNDKPEVRQFTEIEGPIGPLLTAARLFDQPVLAAKRKMRARIQEKLDILVSKFDRLHTPDLQAETFQVHRNKLLDDAGGASLADFLVGTGLAWNVRNSPDRDLWLAMNPKFGAALMSVLALAIAGNEGLHVVTSNASLHQTLLAERDEDVFNVLLGLPSQKPADSADGVADDLAQLVLTTHFDYTMLTAEDIKNLILEEKDLKSFRNRVVEITSDIPAGLGLAERRQRLEKKKKDIMLEWEQYRSLLPSFARKALIETSVEEGGKKVAEHLPDIATAITAGTATAHLLGAAPGFAVSVLTLAGVKMWKDRTNPYKFLNRVEKATAAGWKKHAASLYLPQWSKLA